MVTAQVGNSRARRRERRRKKAEVCVGESIEVVLVVCRGQILSVSQTNNRHTPDILQSDPCRVTLSGLTASRDTAKLLEHIIDCCGAVKNSDWSNVTDKGSAVLLFEDVKVCLTCAHVYSFHPALP